MPRLCPISTAPRNRTHPYGATPTRATPTACAQKLVTVQRCRPSRRMPALPIHREATAAAVATETAMRAPVKSRDSPVATMYEVAPSCEALTRLNATTNGQCRSSRTGLAGTTGARTGEGRAVAQEPSASAPQPITRNPTAIARNDRVRAAWVVSSSASTGETRMPPAEDPEVASAIPAEGLPSKTRTSTIVPTTTSPPLKTAPSVENAAMTTIPVGRTAIAVMAAVPPSTAPSITRFGLRCPSRANNGPVRAPTTKNPVLARDSPAALTVPERRNAAM